jgi:prepilin-type N-terminal cleavage/methylation domain-containing protein
MKSMKKQTENTGSGFTLLELTVAIAIGLIVMASIASLFQSGMTSTFIVAQRAETQQNMRAAIDLMTKDISMAGAGLPSGGLQLPAGTGSVVSQYGCDQSGACYVPTYTYPNGNYMYGIIPGYKNGVQGNAVVPSAPAPAVNDSITVIYADYNYPLWEYTVSFPSTTSGGAVTLTANPIYTPTPPAVTAAGGIQAGDLILLSNSHGSAVGEVTNLDATSLTFAGSDPLNINQGGAASNNIQAINPGSTTDTSTVAYRLFAVTYYLTVPTNGQLPRLMRQVNGLTPIPVADNIINLQFGYDTYNAGPPSTLIADVVDPLGGGYSPNLIQKVNIVVMGESLIKNGNRSQNMYLATSVSARNMAFRNTYQ